MTKRFGVPTARQQKECTSNAFTLAEVLITLGIIGVVAAMTIPTLVSNTNGAQFKTAYKKALSTLNQAAVMNVALADFDFSSLVKTTDTGASVTCDENTDAKTMACILKDRMQSATNITSDYAAKNTSIPANIDYYVKYTCTGEGQPDAQCTEKGQEISKKEQVATTNWAVFAFADGTAFGFNPAAENCSSMNKTCVGFIDVNGVTTPNSVVTCDSTTEEEGEDETACAVSNISDIYPVFIYGQTVEPASDAARAVLFGK